MIQSIQVTNYLGESLEMVLAEPEKSGFLIKSIDGLGAPKADVNIDDLANVDGGIFNSSRANTKNIVMNLIFWPRSHDDSIETLRQLSNKYFPLKRMITIVVKTDNRKTYAIGYVESNEPDIFSKQEGCQISIQCPDPWMHSLEQYTRDFSGVIPMFHFPFSNESLDVPKIIMGELVEREYYTVSYQGDVETGINIIIHALDEIDKLSIYNITTRERMIIDPEKLEQFTGSKLKAQDEIYICTIKKERSAYLLRNGKFTDIFSCITRNSDWLRLVKGKNQFAYVTEDRDQRFNVQFRLVTEALFEGV